MKNQYDYNRIEAGFYDKIARHGRGIRSFWHNQKFNRVKDILSDRPGRILDIGCGCGTFLGMLSKETFIEQCGVDISRKQIEYAQEYYGNESREFICIETIRELARFKEGIFDYVTIIEVIEHLKSDEINTLIADCHKILKNNGRLIITTPNYASLWPFLEVIVDIVSPVKYNEQHINQFTYFNFERKMAACFPGMGDRFLTEFISTTHFVSPFIAGISYRLASYLSAAIAHGNWSFPFGNLILASFRRK